MTLDTTIKTESIKVRFFEWKTAHLCPSCYLTYIKKN